MNTDFVLFYKEHYRKTFTYVYRFVPELVDVEDVCAEVFTAIWKTWSSIENIKHAQALLYRITSNKISDFLRKKYAIDFKTEVFDETYAVEEPEQSNKNEKAVKYIWEVIANFSEKDKKFLEMRYKEGLTLIEIANSLGITKGNAKVRHHRLIIKLKEKCLKNI